MSSSTNSSKTFRWQKLDHRNELILSNPVIERDDKLLDILKKAMRRKITSVHGRAPPKTAPSLYSRYRGTGFPLQYVNGSSFPRWRDISAWLKVQVGLLVLAEGQFVLFKVSLHDQLLEEKLARGENIKVYLRDRIGRCFRPSVGKIPYYFFVFEDRDKTGEFDVPPHAHGAIAITRCPLPRTKQGKTLAKYRKIELSEGLEAAELRYGRDLVRMALKKAAGLSRRPKKWKGKSQARNVWMRRPANPLFNNNWGTYAFKNIRFDSPTLGNSRLVISSTFTSEMQNVWKLITKGEGAISYWLDNGRTSSRF